MLYALALSCQGFPLHFTDEETETRRAEVVSPNLQLVSVKQGLKPGLVPTPTSDTWSGFCFRTS